MGKRSVLSLSPRSRHWGTPPFAFWLAAALVILFGTPGAAWGDPEPTAAGEPSGQADVTVEAQRRKLEHRLNDFISHATARVSDHESLARWNRPICPLARGFPSRERAMV